MGFPLPPSNGERRAGLQEVERPRLGWAWRLGRHGLAEGLTTRKGQPLAKEAKLLAMNVCRIRDGWKRCGSFIPGTSVLIGGASIVAKSHWKE